MSKFDNPLTNIKVASPCPANWDEMYGDNRKRFCGECKLNVYNLSGMSRDDAENLIQNAEGRLCVRFFQRADGTVITADCPVGWARVKHRVRVVATAAFSMVLALFSGLFVVSMFAGKKTTVGVLKIPRATPTPTPMPLMGAVAMPSPSPTPGKRDTPKTVREIDEMIGKIAVKPNGGRD
jgi:hypothetical protein